MRNLQKILALVLALVMSLSLMATAGATDFSDDAEIDETFRESVDVLNGLKVFQGYDNGAYFSPKGDITRAEVAAIIYRIATGDVSDSQVKIYADYNKFSDVPSDHWAAGYINYCTNAEYIKGRGDGKFYPSDKVTGYEALAMILRVVGYDKNGEFTGADWQVQTAATANQRKVTKNVNAGTLGNPASRETVAELLCQAILIEKVNYTLAFGYQISTDPKDTIAYETFQMERLTGVVTGNEIADLKETSPMAAGQTRLVIDGREEIMDIPTGLDSIGKSVRAYIRPQGGTTRKQLVTDDVYDTELNHVYDSFASVSSVGNSTGSDNGINSIAGAEHFVNYDFVNRWTAAIRITYVMDMQWTEYEAMTMLRDNGGHLWEYNTAGNYPSSAEIAKEDTGNWKTLLTSDAEFTYHYTKTIPLDEMLTNQDYSNLYSIFTNADRTGNSNWLVGEVYVGTASFNAQEDISDEIRWTDFVNTYLKSEQNRQQVESNGLGNRLIIIDNDDDGIAEYVLQTIYTIAKISSDAKNVDIINTKLYDNPNSDMVNSTVPSNTLVPVSGKDLAKSEEYTPAAGDVVIYALIDGNIRAQKAETKTEKVDTVNRAAKTITVVGEEAATYKESAVHTHSNGLKSGVTGMVGNTTYTMYFDLDGNLAAYTEGANGGLVLITNGWHNSTITGSEYAVQAYVDGAFQTVNVGANGSRFIQRNGGGDNRWGQLRYDFGNGTINNENSTNYARNNDVHTIVANLDGEILTPVDKAYLYSQNLRILDMVKNAIPGQNNNSASWGTPYETRYQNVLNDVPAYDQKGDSGIGNALPGIRPNGTEYADSYEVRGLADTTYYVVYKAHGTDYMTSGSNVVVREYKGYGSVPSSVTESKNIEDVYAVGARQTAANADPRGINYYTAQVVVIEMSEGYNKSASEQVFIPAFDQVTNSIGIEDVTMIRGNGEKVTVQVDMTHSDTSDFYDPAGGTTARDRLPGLYFMDPSDTNADIYVIDRMSPAEIRDNDYAVGYVRESIGTLGSNYPQIELLTRPQNTYTGASRWVSNFGGSDTVNGTSFTGLQVAQDTIPGSAGDWYGRAYREGTTKTYTYGGSTASLVEAPAYQVLGQTHHKVGTTDLDVNGLNERWDGQDKHTGVGEDGRYHFPNANRNEVLVRYDGNTIVYAISFDEASNLYAQKVWWNCLPVSAAVAPTVAAPTVTFYGVKNDVDHEDQHPANNAVTIAYSVADSHEGNMIDLTVAEGLTIESVLVDNTLVGTIASDGRTASVPAPATISTVAKTLTVVVSNGTATNAWSYTLTVSSAGKDSDLKSETTTAHATVCGLTIPTDAEPIGEWLDKHAPKDARATAVAEIVDNAGVKHTITFADGKWDLTALDEARISHTSPIANIAITVTAEAGSPHVTRHYAERTGTAVVNYTYEFDQLVENYLGWKLPAVLGQEGPTLVSQPKIGKAVTEGFQAITAAVGQAAQKSAYDAAVVAVATAVDEDLTAYVQRLLGGEAQNGSCNYWCTTIATRYSAFTTALANATLDTIQTRVNPTIESIIVHLDYVYKNYGNNQDFVADHGC